MEKLSIIMPVYNEEKNIEKILNKIEEVKFPLKTEIVIVDDCSKDKTREELEKIKRKSGLDINVFYHERNIGKGGAIRTALKHISGNIAIIQDADLEYDPNEIVGLIKFIKENKYDVVYGSRSLNKKNKYSYLSYYLGNVFLNMATNVIYRANLSDMETCYKMIPTKIFKEINLISNGFSIEPEITAKLLRRKYKIGEVPISYYPRTKKEGKKIKWADGLSALWTLIYWRFKRF